MKAKTLSLMTLSILALVLVIGLTSAAITLTPTTYTTVTEQGDSVSFTFTLDSDGVCSIGGVPSSCTLGDLYVTPSGLTGAGTIPSSDVQVTGIQSTIAAGGSATITVTIAVDELQTPGDYVGTLLVGGNHVETSSAVIEQTLNINPITVTEKPRPTEVNECLANPGSTNLMELEIEEITVVSGLSEEDNEWVPLDTVEVEVRVENTENDFKLENVVVNWGLYNLDTGEWVIEEEESDFNIKDDEEETLYLTFTLEDPEDFESNDEYAFFVWTTAEGEENELEVCRAVSEEIDVIVESDFLVLSNFEIEGIALEDMEYPDALSCGSTLTLTADIWNIGDSNQEDIELRIYNNDFGIDELLEIGEVDSFDSEPISFIFTIPEGMEEGWDTLEFTIQEDGDIFENDYTDEDAEFEILFNLENCAFPQAFVSASLDDGGKAGKDLIVRTTITNTGTEATTYLVNAFGYAEWASTLDISPDTVTLEAGQSTDVLITLDVNRDASGEKLFNIEVLSEGQLVMSQPLSVSLEKALLGDVFENDVLFALAIGIALIILAIIIIFIVRARR